MNAAACYRSSLRGGGNERLARAFLHHIFIEPWSWLRVILTKRGDDLPSNVAIWQSSNKQHVKGTAHDTKWNVDFSHIRPGNAEYSGPSRDDDHRMDVSGRQHDCRGGQRRRVYRIHQRWFGARRYERLELR